MGVFFESRPSRSRMQQELEGALLAPPPASEQDARAEAAHRLESSDPTSGNSGALKPASIMAAIVLLAAMAGAALWAESAGMPNATTQLWTAFQAVLGVIVGFLGGEASGLASGSSGN